MLTFNIVLGYQGLLFRDFFWFFFRFFCFSIQLTDPISGNAFNGKQRKKRGMALDIFSFPCWLHSLSFYFWPLASASQGSAVHIFLATNDLIGLLPTNYIINYSLHNRSFMSQPRQMQHFVQSTKRAQSARWRKNCSACNQPIVLALSPTYAHKYWLTLVMSKGPVKTHSITPKLLPFWLPETLTAA